MSTHEKGILEKAATSSDPVVRYAAIRRMEIDQEILKLDVFLDYYASAQGDFKNGAAPSTPHVVKKANVEVDEPSKIKKPRNSKGPRVAAAANEILLAHGQPMQLQDLFAALQAQHADICPPKMESLRPRLHEHRETLQYLKGQGYWPVGAALPVVETATDNV
jgi:hypothetical protein